MLSNIYQYLLIILGVVSTLLFGVFWHRELFPEYKIYQKDYVELEKFRSTYTHEPPPDFAYGIKQIVIERPDKGPPTIDRCTSCHVTLEFSHFSPTKIAYDINGNIELDADGRPRQIPNENYVWGRLDAKIAELTDEKVNAQLKAQGEGSKVKQRLAQAENYKALKTAKVGEYTYDVTKVLSMHPLMGRETRPFEYHPIENYGCVTCHSGNGRGLVTDRAHGPVFDDQYEIEYLGPVPKFTESDPENDPPFSRMFNEKPGDRLLFQTTPILIGGLIEAKCMDCHQQSTQALSGAVEAATLLTDQRQMRFQAVEKAYNDSKQALVALLQIKKKIASQGYEKTLQDLKNRAQDYALPLKERSEYLAQSKFLEQAKPADVSKKLDQQMIELLGSQTLVDQLVETKGSPEEAVDLFIAEHQNDPEAKGILFIKATEFNLEQQILRHVKDTETSFSETVNDPNVISAIQSDVDRLTPHFHRGEELYISQACYACHRIAGFARGGVGPELTREGKAYPWFLKESIVWPQADVPTSTMPNFRMDHGEVADLMTFLLAQNGESKAVSSTAYKTRIQQWEAGRRMPWEESITPVQMHDVRFAMKVFATEGCAACHRLEGFESNVGYAIEKEKHDLNQLYQEREWFKGLVPEMIAGSELVKVIEENADAFDKRIAPDVRKGSILEEIEKEYPGQIETLYTPFKYASRAKNAAWHDQTEKLKAWKERLNHILMVFVQEYGLGRLIGPRPNWSGVFRTDEWLMEHFHNPSAHVPRSIMPVFPFDESKFYALTYMLDVLGQKNRDSVRAVWLNQGFNPEQAFQIHCSQCHGPYLQGNGPVAVWIYPVPKNLRNADFLRNLTKERVITSITHGVKGTPMPPWGEVAKDKAVVDEIPVLNATEIQQLADWIFSALPGAEVIKSPSDVPKWRYTPEDVLKELKEEGSRLKSGTPAGPQPSGSNASSKNLIGLLPTGEGYLASLQPAMASSPVDEVFKVVPNPLDGPDPLLYYIKEKYYTEDNLEEGRAFFEVNCAVCHGSEADGSGVRAGAMRDAKPRMLTNLDWINTRDDLRLLRSIKYGVAGTAMQPWGDQTSSLQRLQLVMFIRSLSTERSLRDQMSEALYRAFDHSIRVVDNARIQHYPELATVNQTYTDLQAKRKAFYERAETNSAPSKEAVETYQKELEALSALRKQEQVDQLYQKLTNEIAREKNLYQSLGLQFITQKNYEDVKPLLALIAANPDRFEIKDGKLTARFEATDEKKNSELTKALAATLQSEIDSLKHQHQIVQGQIGSAERAAEQTRLTNAIGNLEKLRAAVLSDLEEAARSRKKQQQLLSEIQEQNKEGEQKE
ncbi:MAG: c-type cytochrome [Parachlamydia sp.]|nr:c-type cytochrome [Parachlamydia sp.]